MHMALESKPLLLSVSVNCTKKESCKFGSSVGLPETWFCCTIYKREGLSSKKIVTIAGRIILERGSLLEGTTKFLNRRLSFFAIPRWVCYN